MSEDVLDLPRGEGWAKDDHFDQREYTVREDFLNDVLDVAINGGINYWCDVEYDADSKAYKIIDRVDEDVERVLNTSVIGLGLLRVVTEDGLRIPMESAKAIALANAEEDASEIDAELADLIVQVGYFQQVVYG